MPVYWGDYLADTTHLSTEEHGVYLLLIASYWRRGKPIPDDEAYLCGITRVSKFRAKIFRKVLLEFFDLSNGEWTHRRIEKEILRSSGRLAAAVANGRAGGLAKSKLVTVTKKEEEKETKLKDANQAEYPSKTEPILAGVVASITKKDAPNYQDPAVRKQRWQQKVIAEIANRVPAGSAQTIIDGYMAGDPAAKEFFEKVDIDMRSRQ